MFFIIQKQLMKMMSHQLFPKQLCPHKTHSMENTAAASKIQNGYNLSLPISYGLLMSKQWQQTALSSMPAD